MLRFEAHQSEALADSIDLSGAYLFGADGIPVRGDLAGDGPVVTCRKRVAGAVGLALMWNAGKAGRLMLRTTRLPERKRPYNLTLELARARMMRVCQKIEEWGLFDFPEAAGLLKEFDDVHGPFVAALQADDPKTKAELADKSLEAGVTLSEKMALFHAGVLLERRKNSPNVAARTRFGCRVALDGMSEPYQNRLRDAFDFLAVPMSWKKVEPKENTYEFSLVDTWVNFAARAQKPIHVGPVIDFDPSNLPEWLYLWEHDYDSLREVIYKHLEHVVQRYHRQARIWSVVSGLHAYNDFNLSFEQIMELTRMSCQLAKKIAPRSQIMIDLVMPWGEYYARNQRTIPPMLYADMAFQNDIKFDAFGIHLQMGAATDGYYVRDLLQISSLMDEFSVHGKTLHITACQVPSSVRSDRNDAWGGSAHSRSAGAWHAMWSPRLQAEWLQGIYRLGMSKPFVESLCWRDLSDAPGHHLPNGGLCTADMKPKLALTEMRNLKAARNKFS